MDLGIDGRVVLVTGASGAIGGAVSKTFAAEGARVAAGWHGNEAGARSLIDSITQSGGKAMAVRIDQRDQESVAAAVGQVEREFGEVAILVANAVSWPTTMTDTWESLTDGLTANAAGTMAVIEAVLPGMRQAGWGRVVLISTDIVEQPMAAGVAYPAAKGALETATKVLAVREARHGILTNVVRPGFTLTERALTTPGFGQEAVDAEAAKTPTRRICTPRDVASAVAYFGSAANGHANGEVLSVAGGRHLTR
ncbi:short-chain alcohol dehydrogenase like protein [Saccharomonospora marina XMU15]|uniref:Short-chain alcohol dehydrogenase like protein n=1 Tax=Saccharomonospora marina XMU15 TaxID=882083 RepID=H5X976_9PSEU|nr:SDR family NAD(P)-dependent oxidoreductase [Saccharomonospora marina]EHR49178.1 short-chain alcohol dehydrogenase like protein [Saccharomonospora marina XMU15]